MPRRRGSLRVATWNINSLRLRLRLLKELVAALDPDVICLQETKVPDELFPREAPAALGYPHAVFRGMKGYNGVAIFSRRPLEVHDIAPDWCAKGDCRHIAVPVDAKGGPVELHNFYVPAGGDIPDRAQNPKYGHKLDFIAETRNWFAARTGLAPHRAGRRPEHRAAGARCLEPQAIARRGQPHAAGDRGPDRLAERRLRRRGAAFRAGGAEALHLVVVPQPRLADVRPRAAAGPCLGDAGPAGRAEAADRAEGRARLAAGVGPRAGLRGTGGLARAPEDLRGGLQGLPTRRLAVCPG